ncbi:MAG: hypothetical protein KDD69_00405 [Bdellovibrionales bacterium]|nr:hypothetical protein [Bdellovibrionales bacterium]
MLRKGLAARLFPFVCGITLVVIAPTSAYAAAPGTASSGTLIATVLEQVGYHAQAQVLTQLSDFLRWTGALIYLGVVVSMILTTALSGNYRAALWALVGPPIFFWVSGIEFAGTKNTIEGAAVEWRFGAFDDTRTANDKDTVLNGPDTGDEGEVAFLFHKYNELVSEITQEVIGIFTGNQLRQQMLFMARQRTMEDLFGDEILSSDLSALMAYFMVHCSKEIEFARMLARGNRDPAFAETAQYKQAEVGYCATFGEVNKPLEPGPWQDYVTNLGLWGGTEKSQTERQEGEYDYGVVSCSQMWNWVREGARRKTLGTLSTASVRNFDKNGFILAGTTYYNQAIRSIREFLESRKFVEPHRTQSPGDPCPEASGSDATAATTGDDMEALARIFSGFLIKKQLTRTPTAEFFNRVHSGHAGIVPNDGTANRAIANPVQEEEMLRRERAYQFAEGRKYEAYMLLHLLPYLQGLLLYVLSVSYPFFALFLLMPGKAGEFFTWMALWAWAKSWDVGWAMIVIADEVLWELMPKGAWVNPNLAGGNTSPVNLFEAAFDGDYAYSTAGYWMLLSAMIVGVPIVSGHAVLGSKRAMANIMLRGITDLGEVLGNGASDWVGGGQTRQWVTNRERSSFEQMHRNSMGFFNGAGAAAADLENMLGSDLAQEAYGGREGVADIMDKAARLRAAKASRSQMTDGSAEAQELDKTIQGLESQLKVADRKAASVLKNAKKGHDLHSDIFLARLADFDSSGKLSKALGYESTRQMQEAMQERILFALGTSLDDIAKQTGIEDKDIAMKTARVIALARLTQAYGHSNDMASQLVMAYLPAIIGPMGLAGGGALGGAEGLSVAYDLAANLERLHYQHQHQARKTDMEAQIIVTDQAAFSLTDMRRAEDGSVLPLYDHAAVTPEIYSAIRQLDEDIQAGRVDLRTEAGEKRAQAIFEMFRQQYSAGAP